MTKRIDAADEQARLPLLIEEMTRGGSPIVIEQAGSPVAVLVSVEQFERAQQTAERPPHGALALLGLWADVGDDAIDEMVEHIYAERERDYGRPVDLDP